MTRQLRKEFTLSWEFATKRTLLVLLSALISSYAFADRSPPRELGVGLDQSHFQTAVERFQKTIGDETGFSLTDCPLKPAPEGADQIKIGREIWSEENSPAEVTLVLFKNKKVLSWRKYSLPNFDWQPSRYVMSCSANTLTLKNGKVRYMYNWTGTEFKERRK